MRLGDLDALYEKMAEEKTELETRSVKITTTNVLNFVAIEIKAMTERKAALEKEFDEL